MKTIALVLLLLIGTSISRAQSPRYFIKTDGTKVEMHPTARVDHRIFRKSLDKLHYIDVEGKFRKILYSEVKHVYADTDYYTQLPSRNNKAELLMRVIASNGRYMLSTFTAGYPGSATPLQMLHVHEKATHKMAEDGVDYYDVFTDYKRIMPIIKRYFPECTELFDKLEANSKKQEEQRKIDRLGPFEDISNLNCDL